MNRGRGPVYNAEQIKSFECTSLVINISVFPLEDFKTPTRILGSKASADLTGESPHSDSDFHHDIIWDAASPSPNRLGEFSTAAVNISEIVSRIAPKHGRPEVTESTLQQWLGDSFAIPCTPDVQTPKPRKKSPRWVQSKHNHVDDLLKLAKQFDFNMFCRDEEGADIHHQKSLELVSEDIMNFEMTTVLPVTSINSRSQDDARNVIVNEPADEDIDFLFDGPTQRLSGNLTPVPLSQDPLVKPDSGLCGKTPSAGISSNGSVANDKFEDDWENDDLLDDSLVFEMTQNPQKFISPKYCSTQKPPGGDTAHSKLALSTVKKTNVQRRTSFKLESNHHTREGTFQTDSHLKMLKKDSLLSQFSSDVNVQVSKTSRSNSQTPHLPASNVLDSKSGTNSALMTTNPSLQKACDTGSAQLATTGLSDFLDDDLDAIFASDLAWDDPTDDNLLCEMSEDVENNIQRSENGTAKQSLPNKRAPLQPANYQSLPSKVTPKGPSVSSRPAPTVLTGTSTAMQSGWSLIFVLFFIAVARKCTAAEIELKKRQAMERRQQKLQTQAHNF
uniref:Ewing's tumor-associated antigen 1-like n=1 Tax=Cynoglossus semilaevis TaxID=244447 RepID=A0A3P8UNG0_CYNSE